MSRNLRLKCPACQTLIETSVEDSEQRVTLQCAACSHQFTAKVPPRTSNPSASKPIVSARPVASQPVPSRPVPSRPVAAQPIQPSAPYAPQVDPRFTPADDFSFAPAPMAYQPVRKRKPLNLKPFFIGGGSLVGGVLALCLILYLWRIAANTDWSTVRVTDSHEQLLSEWLNKCEQDGHENALLTGGEPLDANNIKKRLMESGQWTEVMLVRAVRLGKAPLASKQPFKDKQKALSEKLQAELTAKLAALNAANKPVPPPQNIAELMSSPEVIHAMLYNAALANYLDNALFDLPAPTNEIEKIYYAEADLVHEYLKQLSYVRTQAQSKTRALEIEKLAEQVMELATRRSKLPADRFEQVPREYVAKDRGFEAAQKALVARIQRDANPGENLKDAVATFVVARDLLIDASSGKSESALKTRLAECRRLLSESTRHGPGDPFYDETTAVSSRDLVVKPRRESRLDPVAEPKPETPQFEPKPQPSIDSLASNSSSPSKPAAMDPNIEPQSPTSNTTNSSTTSTTPPPATSSNSTPSPPSPMSPELRDSFFRGIQDGLRGGLNRNNRMPNSGLPSGSASSETQSGNGLQNGSQNSGPPSGISQSSGPQGTGLPQSGFGPPVDGRGLVFPSQGFGAPVPGSPNGPPQFTKAESVKIIVTKSTQDGNELVKRMATALQSGAYSMNFSNGKITMQIKYSGDLDRVVKLVDFGKVTLVDSPERTLHVVGN